MNSSAGRRKSEPAPTGPAHPETMGHPAITHPETTHPETTWAVVVLDGPDRLVRGVVGPFRSPGYAQSYAVGQRFADWLVVPALFLVEPPGPGSAGIAVL